MNELVYPEMSQMNKLPFTDFTLIRPLLQMIPLMPSQTLYPSKSLITQIAGMRFLPCVYILMPPQVAEIFKPVSTTITNVWFFTRVHSFVDFQVLFLCKAFSTAVTFVGSFS